MQIMKKRKILLTGANGLLGAYISRELNKKEEFEPIGLVRNINNCKYVSIKTTCIDLNDKENLKDFILSFKPNIFIHLAGITRVDEALRLGYEGTYKINVEIVEFISKLCEKIKCKLVYASTDLVYDGSLNGNCDENFPIKPASVYAETKYKAEEKIIANSSNYLILRLALQYGISISDKKNHFQESLCKILLNEKIKLFVDQYRTPIWLKDCSKIILQLCNLDISNEIINLGGITKVSRYGLIEIFAKKLGKETLIEKAYSRDNPELFKVSDVSLKISKLLSYGIIPFSIEETVEKILDHLNYLNVYSTL